MRSNQFIFLSCLTLSLMAFGQIAQAQPGTLPSEQVEVIKIFEAQLAESEKIGINPELPPTDTAIKRQVYEVPSLRFQVNYPAPRIRPVTHKTGEENPDFYKAYLRLGAGLPESILGEGSFNTLVKPSDKTAYNLGLNVSHHSADYSNDKVDNQRFGLTKVEGKGTYYFEQGFAASANLGYTSNRVSYYGYSTDELGDFFGTEQDQESVEQVFGTFDLGLKFFNGVQTAGDFNYKASLDFYNHADNFAAHENGLALNLGATKWIKDRHSLDFAVITDFTWYEDTSLVAQTLHNFTLPIAFTYHGKSFKVKAGGKVVSSKDEYFLFPDLEVVLNLTGNELAFYAGLEGDMKKSNFRALTDYNPYLHTRLAEGAIRNTRYFRGYAGVRGNLKIFEYTLEGSYKPTNDLALYKLRFDQGLRYDFEVVYDDVDIINFSGSIKATPIKKLELTGTLSQNIYNTREETKAWHLPSLEANIQAVYSMQNNKLRTKAQLFLQNGVPSNARGGVGRYDNLNGLFDLSLGAEYWFAKQFGAFLDVNNLLDNKRQRWRYYPSYGINVLAGVSARF